VWKSVLDNTSYKAKLIRIQRLLNIRIAKACHTVSNEALCVIMGLTRINIKIEETAKYYECIKGMETWLIEKWKQNTGHIQRTLSKLQKDKKTGNTIHIYTDGSRGEHGIGSGIAIFTDSNITGMKKYRLNGQCSNNQAEQLAILKVLENIQNMETNERTVIVSTDSRITLESLKKWKNHTYLIEKIGMKVM
jgi:hypothetical protein